MSWVMVPMGELSVPLSAVLNAPAVVSCVARDSAVLRTRASSCRTSQL
jgi:hypothetical protein